jgi:programmed cell death protein 4
LTGFLVRAVTDDVLPPAFVAQIPPGSTPRHRQALEAARAQLSASHFGSRRRHVWGKAATGKMDDLKIAVAGLVQEYLASGEAAEAVRSVKELHAPPFHHEIVKQLVVASMDQGPRQRGWALQLLRLLKAEEV